MPNFSNCRCDGIRQHSVCNAKFPECRDRIRCEPQSEAELARSFGAFEDTNIPTGAPQGKTCSKPTDTSADDKGERHEARLARLRRSCRDEIERMWSRHLGSGAFPAQSR